MAKLPPVLEKFILHWGEMGARWGINRSVAQIHALLYVSPKPLPAEEIAETLGIARSNVSTSLKELQGWGIVRGIHVMGDRRDHFESLKDVWEMFRIILDERKRREVDPTLAVLRECVEEAGKRKGEREAYARERLQEILEFFEEGVTCFDQVRSLSPKQLRRLVKMGDKVQRLLSFLPGG